MSIKDEDKDRLRSSNGQLQRFASFVEGREEAGGQMSFWKRYSFADLPVELISQVYQLFVKDPGTAVYTPPVRVRLMLDEALNAKRIDRLLENDEVVLESSCGSCVFLVEAYKRLVLRWRSKNDWQEPKPAMLRDLLKKVHGVDVDEGAIELGAFSLCLALCDALKPQTISQLQIVSRFIRNEPSSFVFFRSERATSAFTKNWRGGGKPALPVRVQN